MIERRKLQRQSVDKSVKIFFADQAAPIDCNICNVTSEGACLRLATTMGIPESFELSLDNFRSARTCQVVWRNAEKLGVGFR